MKVIVLCAGKNKEHHGFPEYNNIPKCLYHKDGKQLLENIIRSFQEAGLDDIRIIAGWKQDKVIKYCNDNNLNVQFIENPIWDTDALESIRVGIRDIDENTGFIVIFGDTLIDKNYIQRLMKLEGNVWGGHPHFIKIEAMSGIDFIKVLDSCKDASKRPLNSGWRIADVWKCCKGKIHPKIFEHTFDVDHYNQTDEYNEDMKIADSTEDRRTLFGDSWRNVRYPVFKELPEKYKINLSIEAKEAWDIIAPRWIDNWLNRELEEWQIEERNSFTRYLKDNDTILILGSGPGVNLRYFKNNGLNVVGIDLSKVMLECIKDELIVYGDIVNLPFKDNTFDGIWCCSTLKYFPYSILTKILIEVKRILKEDGYAFLGFEDGTGNRINNKFSIDMVEYLYSEERLRKYFNDLSLEVLEIQLYTEWSTDYINFIIKKREETW